MCSESRSGLPYPGRDVWLGGHPEIRPQKSSRFRRSKKSTEARFLRPDAFAGDLLLIMTVESTTGSRHLQAQSPAT
jgi:hypothetical protein